MKAPGAVIPRVYKEIYAVLLKPAISVYSTHNTRISRVSSTTNVKVVFHPVATVLALTSNYPATESKFPEVKLAVVAKTEPILIKSPQIDVNLRSFGKKINDLGRNVQLSG